MSCTLCKHNLELAKCRACKARCEHNRDRSKCAECKSNNKGGGGLCVHLRQRHACKLCHTSKSLYCEHGKIKHRCHVCNPIGALMHRVRNHTYRAFKQNGYLKDVLSAGILGCTPLELREHIERKVNRWNSEHPGDFMNLETVVIDHIKPLSICKSIQDVHDCCHYTNLQPLSKVANGGKCAHWGDADEAFWRERIWKQWEYDGLYMPVVCRHISPNQKE